MAESVKIINPDKTVLVPDTTADCPMAHMASVEKIEEMRRKYIQMEIENFFKCSLFTSTSIPF